MRLSRAELTQTIHCPVPIREREDDRVVELFLSASEKGRYSLHPDWLPQSKENVEVVAHDSGGETLAIEHTTVYAFEDHKLQETLLKPIAESLEGVSELRTLDRRYEVFFSARFLGKLLRKHQTRVSDELLRWAKEILPTLTPAPDTHKFQIEVRLPNGKKPSIEAEVQVSDFPPGVPRISVGGYLPADNNRLLPLVRKVLRDKLPKLSKAPAKRRALMIELPTTDSGDRILNEIYEVALEFPLLSHVDEIVFAKTFGLKDEGVVFFFTWCMRAREWTEYIKAVVQERPRNVA